MATPQKPLEGLIRIREEIDEKTGKSSFIPQQPNLQDVTDQFRKKDIEGLYKMLGLTPLTIPYWKERIIKLMDWGRFESRPNIYDERAQMLLSNMKEDGNFIDGKWHKTPNSLKVIW